MNTAFHYQELNKKFREKIEKIILSGLNSLNKIEVRLLLCCFGKMFCWFTNLSMGIP